MNCVKKMEIIPALLTCLRNLASLEEVAKVASDWFTQFLNSDQQENNHPQSSDCPN